MGKLVLLWEPCYSLGNKNIVWVVRKVRTDILLADLVFSEVQCLPRSAHLKNHPNFRHFDDVVLNLRIYSYQFFYFFIYIILLVCLLLCFLLLFSNSNSYSKNFNYPTKGYFVVVMAGS